MPDEDVDVGLSDSADLLGFCETRTGNEDHAPGADLVVWPLG